MTVVLTGGGCLIVSALLTYLVRRHAIARRILDYPNERSSHVVVTPRGGGLAIALTALGATLVGAMLGDVDLPLASAVVLGGTAVAVIGWIDDLGRASVRIRLAVQFLAALAAVIFLGGMPHPTFGTTPVHMGLWGSALAILGIVWCTNLYNFMDGIDGLAASEAVTAASVGAALTFLQGGTGLGLVLAALAGASGGFLLWNWQPARIFMGDVGSGLVGFLLAVCAVAAQRSPSVALPVWIVLLMVFLMDATVTLLRRMGAREPLHVAHRAHAYQRTVRSGWSHRRVTGAVLVLNALLAVLAAAMWRRPAMTLILSAAATALVGIVYLAVEQMWPMYPTPRPNTPS